MPKRKLTKTERINNKVVAKVRAMTPKEGFASLVASGIYTKSGKLTKHYR
jgi:hypothetical protein